MAQQLVKCPQGLLPSNTLINQKEQVQAITDRSRVQLLEINVKRLERKENKVEIEEIVKGGKFAPITVDNKERKEMPIVRAPNLIKAYLLPILFSQELQKKKSDKQFIKFVEVFKKLHINIPFPNIFAQMPIYAKFLKEILSNKRKLEEHEASFDF